MKPPVSYPLSNTYNAVNEPRSARNILMTRTCVSLVLSTGSSRREDYVSQNMALALIPDSFHLYRIMRNEDYLGGLLCMFVVSEYLDDPCIFDVSEYLMYSHQLQKTFLQKI